jgi:hypothetical protein
MLNRRLLVDDDRGEDEPLNEKGPDGLGLKVRAHMTMVFSMDGDDDVIREQ